MWQICGINRYTIISSKEENSMPNIINDRLYEDVQYVSMTDYIRRVDEIDDFQQKMAFTTRYLLTYGAQQRDVPLAEAIHIAKLKIADASAKIREREIMIPDGAVNPHLSDEDDALNRQFMIDPVTVLLNEANHLIVSEANNGAQGSQRRIDDLQVMSAVLLNGANSNLNAEVSELDIEHTSRDVNARLKSKYRGGAQEFNRSLKASKPGLFSRLFGSSRAYTNLEQAYDAFNNPNHALYGNMNSLDKAATEYLKHCFPTWDPSRGGISKSAIDRLGSPKKDRALLSYNILKSTSEQRITEKYYDNIISSNIQARADREAQAGDEVLDNAEFQQNLNQNLINEENIDLDSSAEREYHANFEDVQDPPEEEPKIE